MTWGQYISSALAKYTKPSVYVPFIALFALYIVTARLGTTLLQTSGPSNALIWPPAGIAFAMVVIYGYKMWPAIFVAAALNSYLNDSSIIVLLGTALANTVQPIIGNYFLQWFKFNPRLSRLRDMFAIMAVAIVVTTVVPTVGMATFALAGELPRVNNWSSWWAGEILSFLIISPFMIRWIARPYLGWLAREWVEIVAAMVILGAIDVVLFYTDYQRTTGFPLVYLILLPLAWIALRMGPQIMTLGLFMTATIGVFGTVFTHTVYTSPVGQRLFLVEIFMEIIAGIFLILVSLVEERKDTMHTLTDHVEQLENALERIRTEDRAKTEFLAILAHELRNPLAPVLSSVELLKMQKNNNPEAIELLDIMDDRVKSMGRILDDLLDISRITQKKFSLVKQSVDLDMLLDHCITTVEVLMRQRNHTLVVHRPQQPLSFDADPVRFQQIINNLLTNAAKYTDPGGTIVLTAEHNQKTLTIAVRDNGIGIQPRMLDHIFEPFVQLETTERSTKNTGLGIGLSLTKQLVDMHGGTIEAHSPGLRQGSEFVVHIPITTAEMPAMPSSAAPQQAQPVTTSDKLHILVVDDNEPAARGLAKLLELSGHNVQVAFNGRGALNVISTITPDVILLDIGLPDMDGYAVARLIRSAISPAPLLIALTGYGQSDDKAKAMAAGFSAHLTKPVGIADVQHALSQLPHSRPNAQR
jgi:signal transduction histidine kinase/ActR/RegA family two-component response regulator